MAKEKKDKNDTIKKRIKKQQEEWLGAFKNYWTISGACKRIGMSRETYYQWTRKYPDFLKRKKEIEKEQLDLVESKLYESINSGNLGAIIFYLKCRGGQKWKEKSIQEIRGKLKTENEQKQLTEEEKQKVKEIDDLLKNYVRQKSKPDSLDTNKRNKK